MPSRIVNFCFERYNRVMNKALQKYTAWSILVFYIPVVLLLGFDHKHEPAVRPPSGKHLVINKLDTHSLSQNPFDGFCPACHFSQGHVFPQIHRHHTSFQCSQISGSGPQSPDRMQAKLFSRKKSSSIHRLNPPVFPFIR